MGTDETHGQGGTEQKSLATKIFRKSALERLSTPDQLDQLVTVNGPGVWMATVTLWALLAGVIYWSFAGSIPTYVAGEGMIINQDGALVDVEAGGEGVLIALEISVGDQVAPGDILGRLDQSTLRLQLGHAQEVAEERSAYIDTLVAQHTTTSASAATLRDSLLSLQQAATARRDHQQATVEDLLGRQGRGLDVAAETISAARAALLQVEQELRSLAREIVALDRDLIEAGSRHTLEVGRAEQDLRAAEREIAEITERLSQSELLVAPTAGRVTEFKAALGDIVTRGRPVLSLARGDAGLEAIAFLPPEQAKDVEQGQIVSLQPAHIKKEEFGAIIGRIDTVSDFPVSPERIRALLENEALVSRFTAAGPSYLARIDLRADGATISGLAWTSGEGPPRQVSPGTIALAEVTIRDRRPIEMVIPFFRKHTGLGF